jgi:hypothetical protein
VGTEIARLVGLHNLHEVKQHHRQRRYAPQAIQQAKMRRAADQRRS